MFHHDNWLGKVVQTLFFLKKKNPQILLVVQQELPSQLGDVVHPVFSRASRKVTNQSEKYLLPQKRLQPPQHAADLPDSLSFPWKVSSAAELLVLWGFMTTEKEADRDKSRKVLRRVPCRSKTLVCGDSGEPFDSLAKEGKAEKSCF